MKELRFNLLARIGEYYNRVKNELTPYLIIDSGLGVFSLVTGTHGYNVYMTPEEREFFTHTAGIKHTDLKEVLKLYEEAFGNNNVFIRKTEDSYIFENQVNANVVIAKGFENKALAHSFDKVYEEFNEEKLLSGCTAPMKVKLLRKVLAGFDGEDVISIFNKPGENPFKPTTALIFDKWAEFSDGKAHKPGEKKSAFLFPIRLPDAEFGDSEKAKLTTIRGRLE